MKHAMLDLETWGRNPGAAIRSVGAVSFDLETGKTDKQTFYANVDKQSCWEHGLHIEKATADWWKQQPEQIVKHLETKQQSIFSVVRNMHAWFWEQNAEYMWCNGANFDAPIWDAAARAVDVSVPWNYWNVRCARSVCWIAGVQIHTEDRKGKKQHNALDDALHQIRCVHTAFNLLLKKEDA